MSAADVAVENKTAAVDQGDILSHKDEVELAGQSFEQWLTCMLNDQPMGNMHVTAHDLDDGTRRTSSQMSILFQRGLGGQKVSYSVEQSSVNFESTDGALQRFEYSSNENGLRTIASGQVQVGPDGEPTSISGTIFRKGSDREFALEVPPGPPLLGDQAAQFLMMDESLQVGDHVTFRSPSLFGAGVKLSQTTATVTQRYDDGRVAYRMELSLMPGMPMHAVLDPSGALHGASMTFGPMAFRFVPADGPVALGEAELALVGMVTTKGPAPKSTAIQRYRLDPAVLQFLPEDGFQQINDDIITVRARSLEESITDLEPLLQATSQLEIDDPELRAWVHERLADAPDALPQRAEHLRLSVTGYLKASLDRGDATALEAFRERKGDCTEHANLLAAALRIAGIPARVEVGLVYAASLGGWGGHAWVSAYDATQQRWIHLDAAYVGIERSLYLRTGSTSNRGVDDSLDAGMSRIVGQTIEVIAQ